MPSPQIKASASIKLSFVAMKFNVSKQTKMIAIEIAVKAVGMSL